MFQLFGLGKCEQFLADGELAVDFFGRESEVGYVEEPWSVLVVCIVCTLGNIYRCCGLRLLIELLVFLSLLGYRIGRDQA